MAEQASGWWVAHNRDQQWAAPGWSPQARSFHAALPDYAPTPLVTLPELAVAWGVGAVVAKDESLRLGLPAFKALGASWALHRSLKQALTHGDPTIFVTATDGNHGRAVARFARVLGHQALIFIPSGVHPAAVAAIKNEGADVRVIDADYDAAVATARDACTSSTHLLVQDTAWDGYTDVPTWIVEGYATLFAELDDQCEVVTGRPVDLVALPVGVGSLAQAGIGHYRAPGASTPALITVEPKSAACAWVSLQAGSSVSVPTTETIMTGLNCGTLSQTAWPWLQSGVDGAVVVTEDEARTALTQLGALGLPAGPCGAAGYAALQKVLTGDVSSERRAHLGLDSSSVVAWLITEGAEANPHQ
jgi:diaminopropionate ammonia-lyase